MLGQDMRFSVIGAGHGGKAMAAHLALMGFETVLFNRTPAHVAEIAGRGGLELDWNQGEGPCGFARLAGVTSDYQEAVAASEVIMVVTPSTAHRDVAEGCAPYLQDGQIVVLNPGRTCGAIEFSRVLGDAGCRADVTVAEAGTFIYASRSEGPARSRIYRMKDAVPLAALPAIRTDRVLEALSSAYPQFVDGGNVLKTSMDNMGAIFHPALTLLNAGRVESTGGKYQFYIDGATPAVTQVLEELDRERMTVAAALGIRAQSALEWVQMAYNTGGYNLYSAIQRQDGYYGIQAPASLTHRYIFEDVPMSLVPIAALGRRYGGATPTIEAMIHLASIIHRTDYWRDGRTLDRLGIAQMTVCELTRYVEDGISRGGCANRLNFLGTSLVGEGAAARRAAASVGEPALT